MALSDAQRYAVSALDSAAGQPKSAYELRVKLRTLQSLTKIGLAADVTPPGPGGIFSPSTHHKFVWAQGRRDQKPSAAPPPTAEGQEAEGVHPAVEALRDVLDAVGALTNPSEMQNVLGFSDEDATRILVIANSVKGS